MLTLRHVICDFFAPFLKMIHILKITQFLPENLSLQVCFQRKFYSPQYFTMGLHTEEVGADIQYRFKKYLK